MRILFLIVFLFEVASGLFADNGFYLGDLSWPEAKVRMGQVPIVIVPFGAGAKEHGPHLPMNADYKVMEYLCKKAVESQPVIVAPPIQHGWFPAFREFPGTEIAEGDVFQRYVYLVGKSLVTHGAHRIVFLNTGISKATGLPIAMAARDIRAETGTPTLVISWDDLEDKQYEALQEQKWGGHADEIETSINLFLQPNLVHMDKAVTDYGKLPPKDYAGYQPGMYSNDPNDPNYSETGITGDPTKATVEKGKKALEIMTANWLKALEGFSKTLLPKK
jgi:creatinine amidohydrolase